MIASVSWVPRGAPKTTPDEYKPTKEELDKIRQELEAGDVSAAGPDDVVDDDMEAEATFGEILPNVEGDADLAEYNMKSYEKEDGTVMHGAGMKGLMYFENNGDPYVTMNDDTDESDVDDLTVRPTDSMIVCAKTEDEVAILEVWVHEEADDNLYVHHDVMLSAFPLSLAWLDFTPTCAAPDMAQSSASRTLGEKGNFVAVGTFEPGIELWDLDVLDAPAPSATLGGYEADSGQEQGTKKKSKKGKSKRASKKLKPGSHSDAVMGLSWNKTQRNLLASCSADTSVKIWDLANQSCVRTIDNHRDKVQCVSWEASSRTLMATAGFDKMACVLDARTENPLVSSWTLSGDAECLTWNPHHPEQLLISTEDGIVSCFDTRQTSQPLFRLQAHNGPTNAISFGLCPNLLATGSIDKTVKLWDLSSNAPALLTTIKDSTMGTVFSLGFCPDAPFALAVGGGKGKLCVLDVWKTHVLETKFGAWRAQFLHNQKQNQQQQQQQQSTEVQQ